MSTTNPAFQQGARGTSTSPFCTTYFNRRQKETSNTGYSFEHKQQIIKKTFLMLKYSFNKCRDQYISTKPM